MPRQHTAVAVYLVTYNAVQAVGWAASLCLLLQSAYNNQGSWDPRALYTSSHSLICFMQGMAFLEIIHAALGLVRSGVLSNILQWAGRSHCLFCVVQQTPEVWGSPFAPLLLLSWALSEVIRYPWYAASTLSACPRWLTWLRYTAFLPLYPVGAVSEMTLMYAALPSIGDRKLYTISMPNPYNFAFDYKLFVQVLLAVYLVPFFFLYFTMLKQRKRKLPDGKKTS